MEIVDCGNILIKKNDNQSYDNEIMVRE